MFPLLALFTTGWYNPSGMKQFFVVLGLITVLLGFVSGKSFAAFAVTPSLSVHTTVLNPQTNSYADSLGLSDTMYHPGDTVVFHITIGNNGQSNENVATVENTLPDYVNFVSGPGNLDSNKKILSFTLVNIAPKTTRSFAVLGKIADSNGLPTNQGIICVADKAVLKTTSAQPTQSSSSFCIQKDTQQPIPQTIYPAQSNLTKTPPTGPEETSFITIALSGIAGIFVKRLSRKVK